MRFTQLQTKCVENEEVRAVHTAAALRRGHPLCEVEGPKGRPVAVCGSGPSLREHVEMLRTWDGDIWAINGALDYLNDNGIRVHGFVACDPQEPIAEYLTRPSKNTTYYLAGCCHKAVFDAVAGLDVRIWHLREGAHSPRNSVPGGTTALTRAPYLALLCGYRDVHILGGDSSFAEVKHAYGKGQNDDSNEITVQVGDQTFLTEPAFFNQVAEFGTIQELWPLPFRTKDKATLTFHVGGMLGAYLKQPILSLEQIANVQHG